MTPSPLPPATDAQAALAGFLRGIERRAAVVAELACGDPQRGDAAVEDTLHAFCRAARRSPLSDWEHGFWSLLLAAPALRHAGADRWPGPWATLGALGPGIRAAVLLRLVAGLNDDRAAAVLGIAPATQALALQKALGGRRVPVESARWQAWVLASRQQLRELARERLVRLARAREDALQGQAPRRWRGIHGWRMPLLWASAAACMLALVATVILPGPGRDATPDVHVIALPQADPPLATFDAETALLTHRDFDQLSAPPAQAAVARELAFYAWYAAQQPEPPVPGIAPPIATTAGTTHAPD